MGSAKAKSIKNTGNDMFHSWWEIHSKVNIRAKTESVFTRKKSCRSIGQYIRNGGHFHFLNTLYKIASYQKTYLTVSTNIFMT